MQQFVDDKMIAGAVTVVGTHDQVLSLECVGSQNLDSGAAMQPETMFRIASMTKPVTAIGIMILVDEGKLSVEDLVEKHLPEFRGQMLVANRSQDSMTLKKPSRPITVRDLLTHTSGLTFMPPGLANTYTKRNLTLAEGVLVFTQRPLDFEPGSKWSYCNSGIDTLGRIIEVLSGQSYEAFLKQRPLPYPSFFDLNAAVARTFKGGLAWPTTAFYDARGTLERTHPGAYATQAKLDEDIRRYALVTS